MSSDRRYDTRRYILEESTTLNNGARTIFIEHMTPGTSVPPHYHTRFSETFDLINGSIQVYQTDTQDLTVLDSTAQSLQPGVHVTVHPPKYHKYIVGDSDATLRVILEPGDADFERLLMILDGLARDGKADELGDSPVMMAMVMELADGNCVGPAGEMLDGVRKEKGKGIEELKEELLQKYDTDEARKRLMAN